MKKLFLLISLYFCLPGLLLSQELLPIQNYSSLDYDGEYQNWSITQSPDKKIYVANNNSLLEFDGSKWNKYESPNGSSIRSVKAKGEYIYTGCFKEFGYWKKDIYGNLNYNSLSNTLNIPLEEEENFWNILILEDWILFQSLDNIYIYDTTTSSFKVIKAKTQRSHLFLLDDTAFFQRENEGLFKIENGDAKLVCNEAELINIIITGVFKIKNDLIILTNEAKFYKYNSKGLNPWKFEASSKLSDLSVFSSIQLRDSSLVLGTISNGMYQISKEGKLIRNINQEKGLNNNTVLSIFEDIDNNIWFGLDSGLSIINIDSPFKEYVDKQGLLGTVYTAKYFNGNLYLGTNQGLFYSDRLENEEFELVEGTEGQVWNLDEIQETLFCSHNIGTFVIEGKSSELISDLSGTWSVKEIPNSKNLLIQGNYRGLSILEKNNGKWRLRNKLEGFDTSSRFFEFKANNTILVNSEFKGSYKLFLDEDILNVNKIIHNQPKGHSSDIFIFEDNDYYMSSKGVFRLDNDSFNYKVDSALAKLVFNEDTYPTSVIITDKHNNRLWCYTNHGIKYIYRSKFNNKLNTVDIAIPHFLRRRLAITGFQNLSHLYDNKYLAGTSNGYVTLNLDRIKVSNYDIYLNSIIKGNYVGDSIKKMSLLESDLIKYEYNNLKFNFSVPQYDKYSEVRYQYQLSNINPDWKNWSITPEVDFSNLTFGTYTLKVRAIVGNTNSNSIINYDFTIGRPWYLSYTAITIYIIVAVLLIFIIDMLYKYYYSENQKTLERRTKLTAKVKNLEDKRELLKLKNEKLQSKLETKNKELAVTQLSLIKKNDFLISLKSNISKINNDPSKIKSLIIAIKQNTDNVDDKKLFEEAFNNADKDFIKKLKSKHSELTHDDLRLCAYLRLNLSSKEIAPLLSISAKSVVMKRYRLRKKLNLDHDSSLTDYILNF